MRSQQILAMVFCSTLACIAEAQPNSFLYQGRVTAAGAPFTGTGQFKVALVDPGTNLSRPAVASATVTGGFITAIAVIDGGSGYTAAPEVVITDATGSGARAVATLTAGRVTGIAVQNAGSGYSTNPTVSVAPPPPNLLYVTYWSHDGSSVGGSEPATALSVPVQDGLFTLAVGDPAWPGMDKLGAEVFTNAAVQLRLWFGDGSGGFNLLSPDQALRAAPYALVATRLMGNLAVDQLTGTLPSALLSGRYGNAVDFSHPANSFTGEGSGLVSLNASAVTRGTLPDARLSGNIARVEDVWLLRGNAATDPASMFLGTTDAQPLRLRAGNRQVARFEGETSGIRTILGVNGAISSLSTNSMILGGRDNTISAAAHESVIAGGLDNLISSDQRSATIGGGARNEIQQDNQYALIAGGRDNRIGTNCVISLVVGGGENRIANNVDGGLMVGGFRNDILGSDNPNRREVAPILIGGSDNEINRESNFAVILGGDNNRIGTNCASAVIAGGTNNLVADNCDHSFAAGRRSRVNHPGSFVWADGQNASFASAAANSFNVRAAGGIHANADTALFFGTTTRQMINLWSTSYGIGVQSSTHYFRTHDTGSFSWHRGGVHSNTANDPGAGGVEMMRLNSGGLRVNGTFVSASDRAMKENFAPVDPRQVLEKVAALPISQWNYKEDRSARHLGPMAQDFHAAFGVGPDDRHIATVDADGVALAAIQGLNQKLEQELERRDRENAELRLVNEQLQRRLAALEQKLQP